MTIDVTDQVLARYEAGYQSLHVASKLCTAVHHGSLLYPVPKELLPVCQRATGDACAAQTSYVNMLGESGTASIVTGILH